MRNLALLIMATSMISATVPAGAQALDPNYPVCMQVFGPATYYECRFTSLAQCAASASGRGAQCSTNPYFANARQQKQRPAY